MVVNKAHMVFYISGQVQFDRYKRPSIADLYIVMSTDSSDTVFLTPTWARIATDLLYIELNLSISCFTN